MINGEDNRALIYGLVDPRNDECRYIGKTTETLYNRMRRHISHVNQGRSQHVSNWIRQLLSCGLKPEIFLIENTDNWREAEPFWIEYFRFIGCNLTNICSGGMGIQMNKEIASKISITRRSNKILPSRLAIERSLAARALLWNDSEWRETRAQHSSETQKILWQNPEHRTKMSDARKRGWITRRNKGT